MWFSVMKLTSPYTLIQCDNKSVGIAIIKRQTKTVWPLYLTGQARTNHSSEKTFYALKCTVKTPLNAGYF